MGEEEWGKELWVKADLVEELWVKSCGVENCHRSRRRAVGVKCWSVRFEMTYGCEVKTIRQTPRLKLLSSQQKTKRKGCNTINADKQDTS